jgi:ribonuclease T2
MPKQPKSFPGKRLSNVQLLMAVVIILAAITFQTWNQKNNHPPVILPTNTSQQKLTDEPIFTPERPAGEVTPSDQPDIPIPTSPPILVATTTIESTMLPFDYFILALSWSPDYCAANNGNDPEQCSIGKKLGFVLHGLWPQNKNGYPSNCSAVKLTEEEKALFPGLYPSEKLYDHEWEKHGTCTGLLPVDYFNLSRQVKASITIPDAFISPEAPFRTSTDQLKQDFAGINPGFSETSFEVNCSGSGRYLKELYVCFSRQGQPTACGTDVHKTALKSCQNTDFLVRNTR